MGTSVTVQDSWVIYCFGKKPLFFASVNVTSLYYSSTGCRKIFGVVFVKCNLGVLNGPVCRASEYLRVSCDIHQPDLSNSWCSALRHHHHGEISSPLVSPSPLPPLYRKTAAHSLARRHTNTSLAAGQSSRRNAQRFATVSEEWGL